MKLDLYEFCTPELQEKLLPNRRRYKEVEDKKAVSHPGNAPGRPYAHYSGTFPSRRPKFPERHVVERELHIIECWAVGIVYIIILLGSWV